MEVSLLEAHVGPAHHVDRSEVHSHERGVLDDLIRKVDAESVARESEAEPHSAVLPAKLDVLVELEDDTVLAEVGLMSDRLDVVLAVPDESAVGKRAAVLQQALRESNRR